MTDLLKLQKSQYQGQDRSVDWLIGQGLAFIHAQDERAQIAQRAITRLLQKNADEAALALRSRFEEANADDFPLRWSL